MCIVCDNKYDNHTTKLSLSCCGQLTNIPFLPNLSELYIFKCLNIKTIPSLSNLKTLSIKECPRLIIDQPFPALESAECDLEMIVNIGLFPVIKQLKIKSINGVDTFVFNSQNQIK